MKLYLLPFLLFAYPAVGHEWYPWECCSGQDCRPVSEALIHETAAGITTDGNPETVGYSDARIKPSPDDQSHVCTAGGKPDGKILCVFIKGRLF